MWTQHKRAEAALPTTTHASSSIYLLLLLLLLLLHLFHMHIKLPEYYVLFVS
jgi:hypothetical protein